ncbi:hypothetical protein B7486_00380 [cyanobacterium TDX16]|nr:hypothetical protein B7486_00380 [cyanobacterium TDX16]
MILIDTSALYAIINPRDQFHKRASRHLREFRNSEEVSIPQVAMFEMKGHLTRLQGNREHCHRQRLAGLKSLYEFGWPVTFHEQSDYENAERWWQEYADWPIDFPDAIIVASARRVGASRIWTHDLDFPRLLSKVAPEIEAIGSGYSDWN